MSQDASGGWRDERKHAGLTRSLQTEDTAEIPYSSTDIGQRELMHQEMTIESISDILTDGGAGTKEQEYLELENDAWAAYHLSEDLQEHYEETGEYWVLEVSKGQLEPVFVVKEDEVITHPDYDVENELQMGIDGEELNGHPLGILDYTDESELFRDKRYRNEELPIPRIGGDRLEKVETDRIDGSYLAPGLAESYKEAAEDVIERVYA